MNIALYSGIETTIKMEYINSEYCNMLLEVHLPPLRIK